MQFRVIRHFSHAQMELKRHGSTCSLYWITKCNQNFLLIRMRLEVGGQSLLIKLFNKMGENGFNQVLKSVRYKKRKYANWLYRFGQNGKKYGAAFARKKIRRSCMEPFSRATRRSCCGWRTDNRDNKGIGRKIGNATFGLVNVASRRCDERDNSSVERVVERGRHTHRWRKLFLQRHTRNG